VEVPAWLGDLLDDAATVSDGGSLEQALSAHLQHRSGPLAGLVATLAVGEADLADLAGLLATTPPTTPPTTSPAAPATGPLDLTVVLSGGAGSLEPAVRWAAQVPDSRIAGVQITLRDSDTGELPHNARRVVAAVDQLLAAGDLTDDTAVVVAVPGLRGPQPGHGWLTALDEIAAMEHRVGFRTARATTGDTGDLPSPDELAACIGAALDRELAFALPAGHHPALRQDDGPGAASHGFLNVLLATRASLDGVTTDEVAEVLRLTDPDAVHRLLAAAGATGLVSARRWFTSVGAASIPATVTDLVDLGLLPDEVRP
jgi:hypothetical protein